MSNIVLEKSRILLEDVASLFGAKKGADRADQAEPRRVLELTGLEDRLLFSATPISPDMIEGAGGAGIDEEPAMAPDADGALVVGWGTENLDGDDWGLAADASYEETTPEDDGYLSDLTPEDSLQELAEGPDAATTDDFVFQWDSGRRSLNLLDRRKPTKRQMQWFAANWCLSTAASTKDYQQLVDDLMASVRRGSFLGGRVCSTANRDGVEQISETLASRHDLDAVHLISAGTERAVKLGGVWLSSDNVNAYAGQIANWGAALGPEADLMFYGSNLASSSAGQTLIEGIGALTGADVAASDDPSGNGAYGGDWQLEYQVGNIETERSAGD